MIMSSMPQPAAVPSSRLQVLDDDILLSVTARAAGCDRRRANWNLHPDLGDPIQRFCNAIEPESYIRPHRHIEPVKWELFLAIQGRAAVVMFDDNGRLVERVVISATGPAYAVEIPPGAWHAVAGLQPGTVLFELKPGPYHPIADKDFVTWAPAEGDPCCPAFLAWFNQGAIGSDPPPRQGE
jgi:cupin fold WbuC family metalloprotein